MDSIEVEFVQLGEEASVSEISPINWKSILDPHYVPDAETDKGETSLENRDWYDLDSGEMTSNRKRKSYPEDIDSPKVARFNDNSLRPSSPFDTPPPFVTSDLSTDSFRYSNHSENLSFHTSVAGETCTISDTDTRGVTDATGDTNTARNSGTMRDTSIGTVRHRRAPNRNDKLTRKRSLNPLRWKAVMRKTALNRGLEHVATDETKINPAKKLGESCGPGCRFKCDGRLSESKRKEIFSQFWGMGDHTRQWDFIVRHIIVCDKSIDCESSSRKQNSRKYFFKIDGKEIVICKTMFLQTLAISDKFVQTAMKKNNTPEGIVCDQRGKNSRPSGELDPNIKDSVSEHINLFPRVESHYVRKDSQREYLEENLSIPRMYDLYLQWGKERSHKLATVRQYRDVFNTQFNIGFFRPKKDQCDVCTEYINSDTGKKTVLQKQYDSHLLNKNRARELKTADAIESKKKGNTHISMCCFDLQKVLHTPQGKSSLFYYRRKLAVYNFTIYDVGRHEGYCYVWTEDMGKKGSNEVASFVLNYIGIASGKGVKEFIFYSDNCSGQNRNRFLFSMYVLAAQKYNVKITHRFLEKGHTQNEGDSVHACIERRSAGRDIHTPDEWFDIIRTAKRTNPYTVIEIDQSMIFDFKELVQKQNWRMDTEKKKAFWSKVKELLADGEVENVLYFKTNFEEAYKSIHLQKSRHPLDLTQYNLQKAYSNKLGISKAKLTDLLFLCSRNAIPPASQTFYKSLVPMPNNQTANARKKSKSSDTESDSE